MRIISLQAENIKRITAIEIVPNGALVQITGKNGSGKSSTLDALWWAIAGAKHIQSAPIRAGESKARIRLDLGEIIVTRTFRRQEDETFTTTITVENADGARFQSPQKMLDSLIGALSFDPLEFTRLKPAEQLAALKAIVPGLDFTDIDAANKKDYDKRTDVNRRCQELRASANAIDVPSDAPTEAIDATALVAELEAAGQHNAGIERAKAERTRIERTIADYDTTIERLKKEIASTESLKATLTQRLAAEPPVEEAIDTTEIRQRISEANTINRYVNAARDKAKKLDEALRLEVESGKLTKAMKDRDELKKQAIAAADFPVRGLSVSDAGVLLDGLPFEQGSGAAKLRTSLAIAMAGNPKLRVIRISDGSLLDEDGLRLVAEMAAEHDFQVWIERVTSGERVGFVIEDGALRSQPRAEAAE